MFDDEATQGIDSEDLLAELEQQTQTDVHRSREGSATTLSTEIQLRLAGASHDAEPAQCGQTLEISKLSILAHCEQSPLVGDIFEICFTGEEITHAPILGICQRCRLLPGPRYEASFQLFSPLTL